MKLRASLLSLLLSALCLFWGPFSWAQAEAIDGRVSIRNSFLTPNERNPVEAQAILNEAPGGAYISVGTERSTIGASLANNTTSLWMIDVDPKAVAFNQINILLLKLSNNREDYLKLRFKASHDEWITRAKKLLTPDEQTFLADRNHFEFWRKAVNYWGFFADNALPRKDKGGDFHNANYLVYDSQFLRLQALAQKDKMHALKVNLNSTEEVQALVQQLKLSHTSLSVLDLSNAWWGLYIGAPALQMIMDRFAAISNSQSLVLLSDKDYLPDSVSPWRYYGFRQQDLQKNLDLALQLLRTKGDSLRSEQITPLNGQCQDFF